MLLEQYDIDKMFFYVKKTFLVFICAKLDILNLVLGKKDVEKGAFCASLSFVRFLRGALPANDLATHIPKDRFIKMFSDSKHVLEKRYLSQSSQNFVFFRLIVLPYGKKGLIGNRCRHF